MPLPLYRICAKCLKRKPIEEFDVPANPSRCAACRKGYYKEYNKNRYTSPEARAEELERSREKYQTIIRGQRMDRKQQLVKEMGGCCQTCGYNKSAAALDFHHREPIDKSRTVSHLLAVQQPWGFEAAKEEAKKCDLICSNCHREKTYPGYELRQI